MIDTTKMNEELAVNKKSYKKFFVLIFLILLCGGGYYFYIKQANTKNTKIQYSTKEITKGDLSVIVSATGNLQPTNSVDIGIEVSGTIKEIYVDYNDIVKTGQVLAKLDTTKLQSSVDSAKAALSIAKANLLDSKITQESKLSKLKRANEMFEKSKGKYPSINEMDDYRYSHESAMASFKANEAKVNQALFELETAQENLKKAVVKSSIDGIVLDKKIEIGQTVTASMTTPVLFTIAKDLSQMELIVSVDEADVGDIKAGLDVVFTVDAYPKNSFYGKIKQVRLNSQVTNGVVTYDTVVGVENGDLLLKPGMTATAQIITKVEKDRLLIPNAALRFIPKHQTTKQTGISFGPPAAEKETKDLSKKDERFVWILKGDNAVKVSVIVLDSDGKSTAIISDKLSTADKVIISQKSLNE